MGFYNVAQAEDRLQDAVTDEAVTSKVEYNDDRKAPKRLLLLPQKPDDFYFNGEDY